MGWTTPTDRSSGYTVTAVDWNIVVDDLTYLYGDAAWTPVSAFTNSWASSGDTVGYILIGRNVYLRGAMTAGTANTVAFTLPVGYRTSQRALFLCHNGTTTQSLVTVNTTGTVVPALSQTVWLSNVSFPQV